MKTYYTYNEESKQLIPAKRVIFREGKMIVLGHPSDFAKYLNAYPKGIDVPAPPCEEGFRVVMDGYALVEGEWERKWKIEPIVYTPKDYDNAMEDYLRVVREKRGYTTREPDDYFGSSNPRWAQDAKDWVAFRDAVMTYALGVINEYTATGNAPTLKEFKAGFPKMKWTFTEVE